MPYLNKDVTEASANTSMQAIAKKPVGGRCWIKRINVWNSKNIDFGRWIIYMYEDGKDFPREILCRKIMPQVGTYGAVLFKGRQEWPYEWDLYLIGKTQDTFNQCEWSIEYEIEPPVKKGWGQ